MADAGSYPKLQVPSNHVANAGKFYYNFLYKAVIVTIFLVILPLIFSSQAPEFINQNLHNTSWELVQLIFVGIAVSFGLFSNRSREETDHHKEHSSKFDNAQSYVSRLLQVSSVFDDDEAEAEAENTCDVDDNKIQTWNSQYYYRGEPVVVVAKEYGHRATTSSRINIGDKPLLLPVRSLKSPDMLETTQESTSKAASLSSNENKFRIGEFQGESPLNLLEEREENLVHPSGSKRFSGNTHKSRNELLVEESVVHRSPIPWRSRSARMEMKEDVDGRPLYPTSPSVENSESIRLQSRSFRSLSSRADSKNSPNYSPNKLSLSSLSPSPSWSSVESQAKSVEDVVRKKNFHRSSTPPPPPPPPPPFLRKSNSSLTNDEAPVTPVKELGRSIRSVPMEFRHKERVEPPRRAHSGSTYMAAKSVGAIRPNEALKKEVKAKEFRQVDEAFVERREYTDHKFMHEEEEFPTMIKRSVLEFPEEEKQEYMEKVVAETHDEDTDQTESEDDYFEEVGGKEEASPSKEEAVSDGGPDVDKKADEFIAKFREQIRLQRIESIRRSTRPQHHLLRNLSR